MSDAYCRYLVGDVRARMAELPDQSVDLVLTSPPFLGLRSYLPPGHPDKGLEIGSEATPGAFLDVLLDLTEEWLRLLAPHGSIAVEMGDTYAGSGGAGGDYGTTDPGAKPMRDGQPKFDGSALAARRTRNANRPSGEGRLAHYNDQRGNPDGMRDTTFSGANTRSGSGDGWPLDKSLCLIPESYRWALVYGRNPFTGRETPRWRARNVVRWCRPNPPVGALADKVRPATSDIVIACMSRRRYFDLDAVRQPYSERSLANVGYPTSYHSDAEGGYDERERTVQPNPVGAPPLDHWWHDDQFDQDAWLIPTQPYAGSHYATWPTALLVKPIEAMCPRRVCTTCGQPSERIVEVTRVAEKDDATRTKQTDRLNGYDHPPEIGWEMEHTTTGWTDCGHDTWRAGVVLDPFAGSGTTLAVAFGNGRSSIGIDLDARNADLARERVGMWLEVDGLDFAAAGHRPVATTHGEAL